MFLLITFLPLTSIRWASGERCCSTIFWIPSGIVAENSHLFFTDDKYPSISFSSSLKPMLSISSASSKTTILTLLRSTASRFTRSINLPGVATTIWVGFFKAFMCHSICFAPKNRFCENFSGVFGVFKKLLGYLLPQFTCRAQYQPLNNFLLWINPMEHW